MKTAFTTKKLIVSGLFAAMIALFTMLQLPLPIMSGYVNLGDSIVLCAAFVLGGWYAACAAAVGSVLADIILGFVMYVPATFIIKGGVALIATLLVKKFPHELRFFAFLIAALLVPVGYFVYESFMFDISTALANIIYNVLQMFAGVTVGYALSIAIEKLHLRMN